MELKETTNIAAAEPKTLIMATNNAHKLREIRQILGEAYHVKGLADIGCNEEIPETADTLEGNALQKARYVHEHYGLDCFADDTGLEVEALNGAPGIYTARFGLLNGYGDSHDSEANIDCLIDKLQGQTNRRARFRTAIALVQGGEEHLFEGIVEGEVLTERTGTDGFGYDPIFAPTEADGKSFAEIGPDAKNRISHRARATQRLVEFLRSMALLLALCLLPFSVSAQGIGQWQLYHAYHRATQCVVAGDVVYANYSGNLLSYSATDTEVRTYDRLHGLNGNTVTQLAYCPQAKRLIIVYDDCGIDLLDADDNVTHIAALKEKSIAGKTISHITVDGTMAYLATGFGMVEMDVREAYLRNSYQIGRAVQSVVRLADDYYAATTDGLYVGRKGANIFSKEGWQRVDAKKWADLATMSDAVIGLCDNQVCTYQPASGIKMLDGYTTTQLRAVEQGFLWGNGRRLFCSKSDGSDIQLLLPNDEANAWVDVQRHGNTFWFCDGVQGLYSCTLKDGSLVRNLTPIVVASPERDLAYQLQWVGDRLLVAGGRNDTEMGYFPATSMYYEDGQWTPLQEMPLPAGSPMSYLCNTTNLLQDPADASHHFASFYRTGLCEYRDGKFVKLYDASNSTLTSILPDSPTPQVYVSCSGAQYDAEGNLWVLASLRPDAVHFMDKQGKWHALHYDEVDMASLCDNYLMHSSGIRFFNSRWSDKRGIFAFDTKETLTNVRDDRHRLRSTITNQDGTSYTPDYFYGMAEDLDGRIWCGTEQGLFVINDAEAFFDDNFQFEQVKVSRNDGSGLADYLLSGTSINCIAIDGGNRKWIGSNGSGVYLISADGQEMIHHFTTDNSPLPSNNILSIAVHPMTGLVMIGTEKGLCSYGGDATEAMDELDKDNVQVFPNPVTPDYRGPIAVRGLSMDSEVKILSSTGQLVWSGTSNGGSFTWNGQTKSGRRAASGVYHIVANNAAGKKAIVSRIIFIR